MISLMTLGRCLATLALFFILISSSLVNPGVFSQTTEQRDCSDDISKCKKPVCYIGRKDDCYCFTCEYGTFKPQNICTNKPQAVKTLLAAVETQESKEKCPD
jgi:hypothetical protein